MQKQSVVFEFPVDFDTQKIHAMPLGRILLGESTVMRLYLTPKGVKAYVNTSKDASDIVISYMEDEIEFVGFGPKEKTAQ